MASYIKRIHALVNFVHKKHWNSIEFLFCVKTLKFSFCHFIGQEPSERRMSKDSLATQFRFFIHSLLSMVLCRALVSGAHLSAALSAAHTFTCERKLSAAHFLLARAWESGDHLSGAQSGTQTFWARVERRSRSGKWALIWAPLIFCKWALSWAPLTFWWAH